MSSLKKSSRRSASLVRLVLVLAIVAVALVSSAPSEATGFDDCAQFCESLCDTSRYQCYDVCDWNNPPGSQALYDCYWNCSLQMGTCRDNCLVHCGW